MIAIIAVHVLIGASGQWIAGVDGAGIAVITIHVLIGASGQWIAGVDSAGIIVIALAVISTVLALVSILVA